MKMVLCTTCAAAFLLSGGAASADPWQDESGKGRWRGDYGWGDSERKFKFRAADGCEVWPAPGSEDTELGVLMELEVGHGETEVHAGVQA
jgi:hypothetical protein